MTFKFEVRTKYPFVAFCFWVILKGDEEGILSMTCFCLLRNDGKELKRFMGCIYEAKNG